MQKNKLTKKLDKFLAYILGRHPDEFGLVPDKDGYVKIKELIKAVNEEDGWRFVRQAHIKEVMMTLQNPMIETNDKLIRARERDELPNRTPARDLPKLLYTCVRRKAQANVMEKGIFPMGRNNVVLSSDQGMAHRMGKRFDADPIVLTVNVDRLIKIGTIVLEYGKSLNLARSIPKGCFTGPPLPKETVESKKKTKDAEPETMKTPGSFMPDLQDNKSKKKGRSKEKDWKKTRRLQRKHNFSSTDD